MKANEMVVIARIATHYEDQNGMDFDLAATSAAHDFAKFKKEAKESYNN